MELVRSVREASKLKNGGKQTKRVWTRSERRLSERRAGEPLEIRICSFATDGGRFRRRGEVLVVVRRRHFTHWLVLHFRVGHCRLHLALEGIKAFSKLFDIAIVAIRQSNYHAPQQPPILPFTWPTLHGDSGELACNPQTSAVRTSIDSGFRTRIAADLKRAAVSFIPEVASCLRQRHVPFCGGIHHRRGRSWISSSSNSDLHSSGHG